MVTLKPPGPYPLSTHQLRLALKYARKHLNNDLACPTFAPTFRLSHLVQRHVATIQNLPSDRLNPSPHDYNITPFVDKCVLIIQAGSGGHGCTSFLREKYIADGPPNGGDGGTGGNVFIQAVRNCTSLNKISKKREYAAGRGLHGQGDNRGGRKGDDILLEVPVGTVIREIKRWDPVQAQIDLERQSKLFKGRSSQTKQSIADKWLFHPGTRPSDIELDSLPPLPPARHASLAAVAPQLPIQLNLDRQMETPLILAPGALGGKGNPHFSSRENPKPKVATKGDVGMRIALALELKLVADVGLVGLPNAGKSTLLRAISNSRARIGSWAFTTLQPNIGTVVLDNNKGRPWLSGRLPVDAAGHTIARITIADIPGIIKNAHVNKGLGLDFLRHVERARILTFVLDLSAGDSIEALDALWREIGEYQSHKDRQLADLSSTTALWDPFAQADSDPFLNGVSFEEAEALPPLVLPSITAKSWFVVATKADMPSTQQNFLRLQEYIQKIVLGHVAHPSGRLDATRVGACAIPISGIRGEGIGQVVQAIIDKL